MASTHLGIPLTELVILKGKSVSEVVDNIQLQYIFFRINPNDGSLEPKIKTDFGYTAPSGKSLVITELDWQFHSGTPGHSLSLWVVLTWNYYSAQQVNREVFSSAIVLDASGNGGASTILTTGFIVPSNVKISIRIIKIPNSGKIWNVILRGYII